MGALLEVGLLSILAQVVLLREVSVAFYGVELIYLLALGVWLLATAMGALAGRWPGRPSARAIAALFAAFAVVLTASVVFVRAARLLFSGVPGAYLPFPQQILAMVLALMPVSMLAGVLFQWAARRHIGRGGTLAGAYGVECLGGLAGGLGATLVFSWGVQNVVLADACVILALAAALLPPACRRRTRARVLLVAVLLVAVAWLSNAAGLDRRMTAWSRPGLVDTRDLPYGRVTIARAEEQLSVFQNDALWFDTQDTAAETFTHLVMLQHPDPGRVLVLGGGLEGLARHALEHSPRLVQDVELDRSMFDMVRQYLPDETRRSFASPILRLTFTDPRRFLRQDGRYDVVLIGAPEPISGEANRFYTREFFAACAAHLNAGGVIGFRLQSAENFWTPPLARRMVSIYRSLKSVFPHIVVLPGTTNVFVASRRPLPADPTELASRLAARHIQAQMVSSPYLRYLYANDRRTQIARTLETGSAPENTDVQPICYEYAALSWLSKFFPSAAAMDVPTLADAGASPVRTGWMVAVGVLVLFGVSRVIPAWRRALLVAVAGLAGMVLETVLILHFQMKNGVVFQDIGMLLMSFMAGLAAGSLAVDRAATSRRHQAMALRWPVAAPLGGFIVLGLLVDGATSRGIGGGLLAATMLLGATGVLVASLFAGVSLQGGTDQAQLVSPLYAADLLGGCAGSLLASLVLIPMAGLAVSARWIAGLAALSLALL
jgi:spermidine synthase